MWTIARTAWHETIRRQVFYIVLLITVLVGAIVISSMAAVRMASAAGENAAAAQMRTSFVSTTFGIWDFAALFLAVFLGAVGYSSEVAKKTIVHVLSRPVGRSTYLAGRWLGLIMFLWAFVALGVGIALVLALSFNVGWTPMVSVTALNMFIEALFYSGVTMALSTFMAPMLAGCCSYLLFMLMPHFVAENMRNPSWIRRILAETIYYLSPAQMPANLIGESFSKELLHPEYGLYLGVMTENLLYAVAMFTLGCIIFSRKELKLR
jgi:ABC-type transport system involved in multi-copper enzyme maturation permease subunit